jgi:hypothetical protein
MRPAESILRCAPTALHVSQRRLMGGLAYAFDGVELYFERLVEAARTFYIPGQPKAERENNWTAAQRLSVIMDAWACVDNVNRCRQLVGRFRIGDPRPTFIDDFLAAVDPVRLIRNRIQHLDEDYTTGTNFDLSHPVFGAVTWVDGRFPGGCLRFGISSGPAVEGGLLLEYEFGEYSDDVSNFSLMAFDRKVVLDSQIQTLRAFIVPFEELVRKSISRVLREAAESRAVSLEVAGKRSFADMITCTAFHKHGDQWTWLPEESSAKIEVPPGVVDLNT